MRFELTDTYRWRSATDRGEESITVRGATRRGRHRKMRRRLARFHRSVSANSIHFADTTDPDPKRMHKALRRVRP